MKRRIGILIGIICVLSAIQAHAQAVNAPAAGMALTDPLALDPKVAHGTLENGVQYFVRVNTEPENRAELRLVVNAGSILEDDDQQGLAHFVEHMAFNGTKNFAKQELVDYLESIGMQFGPEVNAYTSFDETVYELQIPLEKPEIVEKGFQILEDWAHFVSFDDEEIDKERGVLIEEWRLRRGADARIWDKQAPIFFKNSQYAQRLIIGKKEILESFAHDTLRRFYRDWYRPDLMAVIAVGDFDQEQIIALIKQHFGAIPMPPNPRMRTIYPVPDHQETLWAIVTDPEQTDTSVEISFKQNVQPEKTAADYRRLLVENIYNSLLNQRLTELADQENPPFISAYSYKNRIARSKDAYSLNASTKDDGIARGLEAILREAERVKQHGFTQSELDRAKKQFLRGMEQTYSERNNTPSSRFIWEYVGYYLNDAPSPGIEAEYALSQKYLPDIRLEEVNQLAQQWMTGQNRVVLVDAPEKAGLTVPTAQELSAVLNAAAQQTVAPYIDRTSEKPLLAVIPLPETIVEERRIEALNVTELKLSNGVRVILKPTDFKDDEILFSAFSFGGHSLVIDKQYTSAAWAASLIEESGIGEFDKIELGKKLADKALWISPYIDMLDEGLYGGTSPKDLETLFQLIYLYFTAPVIDDVACKSYIQRTQEELKNRSAMPEVVFHDTVTETMSQGHYRARPLTADILNEINLGDALDIYKDRFADASDFVFVFVGNFTVESLKPFLQAYLGNLPSIERRETWRDVGIRPPTGVIENVVKKGIEPKSRVEIIFSGDYEWSRQNNYDLAAMIGVLDIKLRETLREDMGGTYGVGVNFSTSRIPTQAYTITISFGCNPQRVDEMVAAVFQQIEQLKTTEVDALYITKVKETNLRTFETNQKENNFWLHSLNSAYYHNQNPLEIMTYPERVATTSAANVQKTAQQYFNLNNYVSVILYPEK